jgi:putative endonuclease
MAKDVDQRVKNHNSPSRGAKYTRTRRPVELGYRTEGMDHRSAARLERKIKRLSHEQKKRLCEHGGS